MKIFQKIIAYSLLISQFIVSCAPPRAVVHPQLGESGMSCPPCEDIYQTPKTSHLSKTSPISHLAPASNTSDLAPTSTSDNSQPIPPSHPTPTPPASYLAHHLPDTLSCYAIDGSTQIVFVFNPDRNRFEYAQYKRNSNMPFQDIQSYPAIPDPSHSQPCFLSTILKAQFAALLQEGKWDVTKQGDLKFYGIRGKGGSNPNPDKMDLEAGMTKAASSSGIIRHQDTSNVSHTSTRSHRRVSIAPQSVDIELGEKNPNSTSSVKERKAQEGAPLVYSDASARAQEAPKKKQGKREKAAKAVKKAHAKSHHVTNRITQAEEDCYQSCVRGMARQYNTWMNGEHLSQAQRESREIICGFWKGLVLTAAIGGIIGSGILHEFENGNLDLDKINSAFSNYTGSNASLFNNSFLDDKHWGDFLDDLKGLKEQEIAGSKTYSKGAFTVRYTPPNAYYQFLDAVEPINKHLNTVRGIGNSVKDGLSGLDPCNAYQLPSHDPAKVPTEADKALLTKFQDQCRAQGHINYEDFITGKSGLPLELPTSKQERLEKSVCQNVIEEGELPPTLAYQQCLFNLCTAAEVVGATVTVVGTITSFVPVLSGFTRAAEKAKDMLEEVASLTMKFSKMVLKAMRTLYRTEKVYLKGKKIFVENPKAVIKGYLQNLALIWMLGPDVIMNAAFIYILKSYALTGHQQMSRGLLSRTQLAGMLGVASIIIPTIMSNWELPIGNLSVQLSHVGYAKALLLVAGGFFLSVSPLGVDPTVERLSAIANLALTGFWGIPLYGNNAHVKINVFGCGEDNPFNTLSIGINNVINGIYSMIPCGLMGELIMNVIPEVPTMDVIDMQPTWCGQEEAITKTEAEIKSLFQAMIGIYISTLILSQVASIARGKSYDILLTALTATWVVRSFLASDLVLSMPYMKIEYKLPPASAWEVLTVACCLASPVGPPLLSAKEQLTQLLKGDDADECTKVARKMLAKEFRKDEHNAATKIQAAVRAKKGGKSTEVNKEKKTGEHKAAPTMHAAEGKHKDRKSINTEKEPINKNKENSDSKI